MFLLVAVVLNLLSLLLAVDLSNPVIVGEDCHATAVVRHNGVYYGVSSSFGPNTQRIPIRQSLDLKNWEKIGYVLNENNIPSWAKGEEYALPEIYFTDDNQVRVYFTVSNIDNNYVIAVPYSDNILGPYQVLQEPFVHLPNDSIGVRSPYVFRNDDNQQHFLCSSPAGVSIRPLDKDGLSFSSEKTALIVTPTEEWEFRSTNSPVMYKENNKFFLFYSGVFGGIGYASGPDLYGNFTKSNDLLLGLIDLTAAGDCSIVKNIENQTDSIIFSAFDDDVDQYNLYVKKVTWINDVPAILDI